MSAGATSTDLAAIHAELDAQESGTDGNVGMPKRSRAVHQPLPAGLCVTATNWLRASATPSAKRGSRRQGSTSMSNPASH